MRLTLTGWLPGITHKSFEEERRPSPCNWHSPRML